MATEQRKTTKQLRYLPRLRKQYFIYIPRGLDCDPVCCSRLRCRTAIARSVGRSEGTLNRNEDLIIRQRTSR